MARLLITGGLGAVGVNYALHAAKAGHEVILVDNRFRGLSNSLNEQWLWKQAGKDAKIMAITGDVANADDIDTAMSALLSDDPEDIRVLHAAAQASVDYSIKDPGLDFAYNVIGTFNLLEALRNRCPQAKMIHVTSNKIYDTTDWPVEIHGTHYSWVGRNVGPADVLSKFIDAKEPYGASKIAGLYYSRCYAAMYNMPIVIAVPSGMYGPRQFGRSGQGWMGWFTVACALGYALQIKGDGFQVRDMVHVNDVNTAMDILFAQATKTPGELFNIGGGPRNAISLIEALTEMSKHLGKMAKLEYVDWRPQDNKVYISNIEKMISLGWSPTISVQDGIKNMCEWVVSQKDDLESLYRVKTTYTLEDEPYWPEEAV